MQMRDEAGIRLKALLWSELAFVTIAGATRTDHSDGLMELLSQLDVEEISYDPDGFDERVRRLRKELKRERAE
jgi:acyl-CoA thioester hydrolase